MNKVNRKVLNMVYAAVFAAMIFALTRFIQIPVPGGAGYLHFGDAMIYIVASTLGGPWALLASVLGAAIADLSSVFAVYAPISAIVKVLIALPFVLVNKKSEKILTPLTICLTIPSGVITVLGYFLGDLIVNKAYAVADIPMNIVQAVGSAIIFVIISAAFDAAKLKKKLFINKK
jgi:uncharacterized repeat protein (TIGR04002 family)